MLGFPHSFSVIHRSTTLNILLIANQQRLQQVLATAASLPDVSLRVATSLDDGDREIDAALPSLIFLQNRLSGLSAEIITRHVKSQLGKEPTRVVLLAESSDAGGEAPADAILDIAVTDEELVAAIERMISEQKNSENTKPAAVIRKPAGKKKKTETKAQGDRDVDAMFGSFEKELASILGKPTTAAPSPPAARKKKSAAAAQSEEPPSSFTAAPAQADSAHLPEDTSAGFTEVPIMPIPEPSCNSSETGSKDAEPSSETGGIGSMLPDTVNNPREEEPVQIAAFQAAATEPEFVPAPDFGPPGSSLGEETAPVSAALPSPDLVEDTVTIGEGNPAATDNSGSDEQRTEAPVKFQEELDTLLGTATAAPTLEHLAATGNDPALVGPTVDEFMQFPQSRQDKRNSFTWPIFCLIALAVAGIIFLFMSPKGAPPPKTVDIVVPAPATKPASSQQTPPPGAPSNASPLSAGSPKGKVPEAANNPVRPAPIAANVPAAVPTAAAPPPLADAGKRTSLPSFIRSETLVKEFGASNPGWEKYLAPDAEFRVYREKSSIMALQVIDRSRKGISRAFFTRTIREMTGARDYRLESKENKGNYLIKKGKLPGNARVILYKKNADKLQAFVIYFQ